LAREVGGPFWLLFRWQKEGRKGPFRHQLDFSGASAKLKSKLPSSFHELAHAAGVIKSDSGNQSQSQDNSQKVYDAMLQGEDMMMLKSILLIVSCSLSSWASSKPGAPLNPVLD
jgi:hypothetical protein